MHILLAYFHRLSFTETVITVTSENTVSTLNLGWQNANAGCPTRRSSQILSQHCQCHSVTFILSVQPHVPLVDLQSGLSVHIDGALQHCSRDNTGRHMYMSVRHSHDGGNDAAVQCLSHSRRSIATPS